MRVVDFEGLAREGGDCGDAWVLQERCEDVGALATGRLSMLTAHTNFSELMEFLTYHETSRPYDADRYAIGSWRRSCCHGRDGCLRGTNVRGLELRAGSHEA